VEETPATEETPEEKTPVEEAPATEETPAEETPVAEETPTETVDSEKTDAPKKRTSTGSRRSGRSRRKKSTDKDNK
jgi:hypothetical protein